MTPPLSVSSRTNQHTRVCVSRVVCVVCGVCAGDGPYTALAVARECGMIDLGSTVALGHTGQVLINLLFY